MKVFLIKSKRSYVTLDRYHETIKSTKITGNFIFVSKDSAIEVAEYSLRVGDISDYKIITCELIIKD